MVTGTSRSAGRKAGPAYSSTAAADRTENAGGFYMPQQLGQVLGVSAQAVGLLRMAELGLGKEQAWWE